MKKRKILLMVTIFIMTIILTGCLSSINTLQDNTIDESMIDKNN